MNKTILYIGWIGFGNQGDDLCYDIFVHTMSQRAKELQINLRFKGLYPAQFNEFSLARINPDLVVLGAGSLFEPVYLRPLIMAEQNGIPTAIWGSGYDSLLPTPIDASLIDPDSAFMIRHVVQHAQLVGIRGPYTKEMLDAIGATNPALTIVGDPGLLLDEIKHTEALSELDQIKDPIIAINWGTASNKVLGGNEKDVAADLVTALSQLSNEYTLVIYPVWPRDIPACQELYASLGNPNTLLLERVPTMNELIYLYQKSMLSVNMKLHANVFSAALDCPFVTLAYRMKSYDFASSLDWTDFTILFSDEDRKQKISTAIEALTKNQGEARKRLREKKNQYTAQLATLEDHMISLITN